MTLKLYVTTGTAKVLMASSLFAEFHPDPAVVLFPDLLFHLRVLDSVSLAYSEALVGTLLF